MMNNLFKSALQGVVQRMATPENIQSTFQFVSERFVREVPRSEAVSRITDANYDDFTRRISESRFVNFPVYLSKSGSYHVVYEQFKKQVFSTMVQEEAFLLASILERMADLAFEAYNFDKLDLLIETILAHQSWSNLHFGCFVGCISYISSLFGKMKEDQRIHELQIPTNDTGEISINLAIRNGNSDVVTLLVALGADLKAKNKTGETCFHVAAIFNTKILQQLVKENKTGILEKNNEGKMPIIVAGEKNNFESVKFLSKFMDYEIYQKMLSENNCPLHFSGNSLSRKQVAEIILEEHPEFIEIQDSTGQTPIIANVKNEDLSMVLVLIAHGSDINQHDKTGKSPLIYAMEKQSSSLVKLFLALGADYQTNVFKQTFDKLKSDAKKQVQQLLKLIEPEERPKPTSLFELAQNRVLNDAKRDFDQSKLKLLSMDGGGIRGLASILILTILETKLRKKLGKNDIKLIDHFDWLAGTSTGAIIGLALVSGKSTMDVLRLYLRFRDKVFNGTRPYDTRRLESVLQREFGLETTMDQLTTTKKIFVTTTKATTNPPELEFIRNYDFPGKESTKMVKVWHAARCSSAAPTYFEAVDNKYLDGGLMANNPCSDLIVEVVEFNEYLRFKNQKINEIGCVLSIGTGKCPIKPTKVTSINMPKGFADILANGISSISSIVSLSKMFIDQICSSDGPVSKRSEALAHSLGSPFFRLTPNLAMEVDLDSADDQTIVELVWSAKCHCEKTAKHQIDDLIDFLTYEK